MDEHVRISKSLSYWLRHRPDEAGLALDGQGWASLDAVLAALAHSGLAADIDTMLTVVDESDKQRFELTPDLSCIRARQGHSVAVDLALARTPPPAVLYHGTVERFLAAIMRDGLQRMARHHVHFARYRDRDACRRAARTRGRA